MSRFRSTISTQLEIIVKQVEEKRKLKADLDFLLMPQVEEMQAPPALSSNVTNKIEIKVRRNTIMEDSYRQIHSIPTNKVDTLKTKLWIEFDGEVFFLILHVCITSA